MTGFPLVVCGFGLMLFGWRMWKICVVVAFGVLGTLLTLKLFGLKNDDWLYGMVGGVLLAGLSYWPANFSISVLGGIMGSYLLSLSFENMGLSGATLWFLALFFMVVCTAYAHLHRQQVVIVVTSSLGSVLLTCGLFIWLLHLPGFFTSVQHLLSDSVVLLPFMILVPTVMSLFYQEAEVRRLSVHF